MNTGMRPFHDGEADRVRTAFHGRHAARNRALFELGMQTGYRISELLSLGVGDVLTPTGEIVDRLTVRRRSMKGKRASRSVVLNRAARAELAAYLQHRQTDDVLLRDEPLFPTSSGRRLGRQAAWAALTAAYGLAGVGPQGIGTHGMRKTFAMGVHDHFMGRMRDGGRAIDVLQGVQAALGHASIDSTIHYLRFLESDVDAAVIAMADR